MDLHLIIKKSIAILRLNKYEGVLDLFKMITVALVVTHYFACIWHYVGILLVINLFYLTVDLKDSVPTNSKIGLIMCNTLSVIKGSLSNICILFTGVPSLQWQ